MYLLHFVCCITKISKIKKKTRTIEQTAEEQNVPCTSLSPAMAAPPPQGFPYDNLFKILIIGDAATGKVSLLDT
jgi:hypothetical protein